MPPELKSDIEMSREPLMYCCRSSTPGTGYAQRALALAGELSEQFEVTMLLTSEAAETAVVPTRVKLELLPELGADNGTSTIQPSDVEARRDLLLRIFDSLRPRVLAIDGFPFTDYPAHDAFLGLVREARSGRYGEALVACLTDGILANNAPNNESLADSAGDILDRYFDIVIVRTDPVFARLDEFFSPHNNVHTPLYHTGFIARDDSNYRPSAARNRNGIVVSAGDGLGGMALYDAAIEAHRILQQVLPVPMTIITGRRLCDDNWQTLQSLADGLPDLKLRRSTDNLAADLAAAQASISQCDYNTAVDVMRTRTPSLFVPNTDMRHRKQIERARRMVYWGAGRLLMPRHLNAASLVNEIHQLTRIEARRVNFDLNGAQNTAQLVADIVYRRSYTPASTAQYTDKRLH